tara:strand:+ start:146 stop:556 length:411 start_codon:yes stop_codon:yes gene_type:complete
MRMDHGKSTTTITGIGTSYDPSKGLEVDLNFVPRTAVFLAKVSLVQVFLSNLSGSSTPTKLTISISEDQQGDQFFLTDTQSTIQAGLTTSTDGTALYMLDVIVTMSNDLTDKCYVFFKVDQGSCDIQKVTITWEAP